MIPNEIEFDIYKWLCADCNKPLIDCPGQAKRLLDGKTICEPCNLKREIRKCRLE